MLGSIWTVFDSVVRGIMDDATDALGSPSLIAAGRRVPDPFAYTNVLKRWYQGVRNLELSRGDLSDTRLARMLEDSDLPSELFDETKAILLRAKEEDWTAYRTKRHLSKALIPKQGSDQRSIYQNRVRRMARTAATAGFNHRQLEELIKAGYTQKRWVSRHDSAVRDTHTRADGQVVDIHQPFLVGDVALQVPGDYDAPIRETANCRCVVVGVNQVDNGTNQGKARP